MIEKSFMLKEDVMRRLFVFLLLVTVFTMAVAMSYSEAEKDAVKTTCLDYIEGWYEGNPARMERALHPDLAKRGLQMLAPGGETLLNPVSASSMVVYTRAGIGKLAEDERNIEVKILDIDRNMASVKISSAKFIDYCHLAKFSGAWRIVNVLWEGN